MNNSGTQSSKYLFHILFWNDETEKSYSISVMYMCEKDTMSKLFFVSKLHFWEKSLLRYVLCEFLNEFLQ